MLGHLINQKSSTNDAFRIGSYLHAVPAKPNVISDRESKKVSVSTNAEQMSYQQLVKENESGQHSQATEGHMGIIPASFWHPTVAPRVAPTMAADLTQSTVSKMNDNRSREKQSSNQQKPNPAIDSLNQVSPGLAMALLGLAGPRWGELSGNTANFQ